MIRTFSTFTYKKITILSVTLLLLATIAGCGGGGGSSNTISGGSPPITGGVTLNWNAPNDNDLAGFNVYYGTSHDNYTNHVDVGNVTTAFMSDLASGLWCFAIKAYDTSDNESDYSNEACITL